jgi:hypothetical protein
MKTLKRDLLLESIHKGLLKAYAHIPVELEQERKQKASFSSENEAF